MYAIDTNILVRWLVQDNPEQTKKVLNLFKRGDVMWISLIVLVEFYWVCCSCYKLKTLDIITSIENLLSVDVVSVENIDAVRMAINSFHNGNGDFVDLLICSLAKVFNYCPVFTFDKNAGTKSDLFEIL